VPQREAPDQDYFPSARLTLSIRFEEFASPKPAADAKKVFAKPPIKMTGIRDTTATLVVQDDPAAPAGTLRKLVAPPGGAGKPAQDATSSADQFTFDLGGIIPKNMTIGLNGARKASLLTATMRYLDCPIDPRTIRSCAVSAYLGTLTQDEVEKGQAGATRGSTTLPLNIVPDTYLDEAGNQRTNLRFQGWVDEWEMAWDDSGEPTIKIECRDNTTLLDAQQHPPKLFVDMSRPIHEAVAGYLANFPQMAGISVEYRPSSATPPTLKDALAKTAFRPNLGPPAKGGGTSGGGGQKTSVLDYLTDICGAIGHLLRVEGTVVIVQEVRSLVGGEFPPRPADPYRPRDLPSGKTSVRRMIYGRNISEMKCRRKYAKGTPTNIEVRCYNPTKKTVLVARFPDAKDASNKPVQGAQPGDGKEQKWSVHYVSGIESVDTLKAIARGYYELMGRGEIEMELKTKNLASFGGGNLDPDILDMAAGDSFEVLVNRETDEELASASAIETLIMSQGQASTFMGALGYDADFTAAYVKSFTNVAFPTVFKLRHLGLSWDCDEGVSLMMQGVNYVEVRLDQGPDPGAQSGGTPAKNQGA
jgi:hypothetical protein